MKINNLILISFVLLGLFSCTKESDNPTRALPTNSGVYVLNEGQFGKNNASISFISDDDEVVQEVFSSTNDRPLGDVLHSGYETQDAYYLVVNNSGKIEKVNKSNLKSVSVFEGFVSPRYMTVHNNVAMVSNLGFDSTASTEVNRINLISGLAITPFAAQGWTENLIVHDDHLYVSNTSNDRILVYDLFTGFATDTINTYQEPQGLVIDKNGDLWILCTGGYTGQFKAALHKVNTSNKEVIATYEFENLFAYPTKLTIDETGNYLYFLNTGLFQMSIDQTEIPTSPLIEQGMDQYFYGFGLEPDGDRIYIGDAGNFTDKGKVLVYDENLEIVKMFEVGYGPNGFLFKN